MIQYEQFLYNKGIRYIAGVDEVGRGPLAGPLVVCAVILNLERILSFYHEDEQKETHPAHVLYSQINDSKKLTCKKRVILNDFIINECISYSISEISNYELDRLGISRATQLAFENSVKGLKKLPEHILTDTFEIKSLAVSHQTNITRGDQVSISIAAASIVAKVYRDGLMIKFHEHDNGNGLYEFDKNKGYGTKKHIEAIRKHGICDIHRRSFEPIKSMIKFHSNA